MLKSLLPLFEHSFQEKAKTVIDQDTETHPLSRVELSSVLTSFLWVIIISESLLGTFSSYFCTKESLLVQWLPHWLCSDNPFTPTLLLGRGIRIHLFLRKKIYLKKSLATLVLISLSSPKHPSGVFPSHSSNTPQKGQLAPPPSLHIWSYLTPTQTHCTQPGTHSCPDPPYMDKYPP